MKHTASLLLALSLGSLALPHAAQAQDIEDLDGPVGKPRKRDREKPTRSQRRATEEEIVREVERGLYARANFGGAVNLLNRGFVSIPEQGVAFWLVSPGTAISLAVGSDIVDNERSSLAIEGQIYSGLHNGANWEDQGDLGLPPSRLIQGDTRTFALNVAGEYSVYPSRRFGIGLRVGVGAMYIPLLLERDAYANDVLADWGVDPGVHNSILPQVLGGPTIEYYTKLSHFSVGIDVDAVYTLNYDLTLVSTGYLKYTF